MTEQDELVAALLGVVGVAAAAVEPAPDGPGTLRLQLAPGADEVAVAGEVNHLLRDRFGLAVDTDRVRVLDDGEPQPSVPAAGRDLPDVPEPGSDLVTPLPPALPSSANDTLAPTRPGRLVIDRVQLSSAGLTTAVTVTLRAGGRSYVGLAEGTATAGSLLRAVAMATLRGVESVVEGGARFDVEHVEIAETGGDRTALVVVTMVTDRATQRLSGASVVREDTRQAVIRAVLAAVNRRLEALLDPEIALP